MPSPQEILSDPKFLNLDVGEQLKVMRTVDPNFSALPPKEQGTVIAHAKQKSLGYDKIGQESSPKTGFFGRIGGDITGTAKTLMNMSPMANPADRADAFKSLVQPNIDEGKKALDPSLSRVERFGHGMAAVMPGVGPVAARTGEDLGSGDYGAAAAGGLELFGPKAVGEFGKGFREGWDAAGPKAKSAARGANAPWRQLPTPTTPPPPDATPIQSALPSGRTPGGIGDPRTIPEPQPASTAQKLPVWHMIRDQVRESPGPADIGISPKNRLPRPKTPTPATATPVDAPGVSDGAKSAAELMKTVGIGPDEILKATPAQWQMIENQVGQPFDRQEAIQHLGEISKPKSAPGKPSGYQAGEKSEIPAERADAHADTLGKFLRKTKVRPEDAPAPTDDAAWKLLEKQTGTVATPAVRQAALETNRKLWSASQADLQSRRAAHFGSQ